MPLSCCLALTAFVLIIVTAKRMNDRKVFGCKFPKSHLARCIFQGHTKSEKCRALCVLACHVACGMVHLWGLSVAAHFSEVWDWATCSWNLNLRLLFRIRDARLEWEFFYARQRNTINSRSKSIRWINWKTQMPSRGAKATGSLTINENPFYSAGHRISC